MVDGIQLVKGLVELDGCIHTLMDGYSYWGAYWWIIALFPNEYSLCFFHIFASLSTTWYWKASLSPMTISVSPVLWPFKYLQSHNHFNIPSSMTISISAVARPFQYPKSYDHFNIPQSHDHFNIPSPMTISKSLLVKLCWTFVFNWLHTCLECLCSAEYVVVCLNMNSDCAIQILMSVNSRCAAWNCLSFCSFSLMIWILILNFSLILFE